jgi:hypothetical protein
MRDQWAEGSLPSGLWGLVGDLGPAMTDVGNGVIQIRLGCQAGSIQASE